LPAERDQSWSVDAILEVMQRDKKAIAGRWRFVLPTRIGQVELVDDIEQSVLRMAMRSKV
jgi:3-dehydroquinate synthase